MIGNVIGNAVGNAIGNAMETLARFSPRRVWLVARRDYFGYIKTWGFWLSFFLPVLFGVIGFALASADVGFSPTRLETVIDRTGEGIGEAMIADWRESNTRIREAAAADLPESMRGAVEAQVDEDEGRTVFVSPPAPTIEALQPYLRGERTFEHNGEAVELDGALEIYSEDGVARARYWTETVNSNTVPRIARSYFRDRARENYLREGGLSLEGYREATAGAGGVDTFDPSATEAGEEAEAVTVAERVPYYMAAGLSFFLWFTVFSGAYMLLTSMLEEKLGKLLEMVLATTQFAEIMLGKLLGVALLTLTAMAPYILLVAVGVFGVLTFGDPDVVRGIREAFSPKMAVFFPLFLLLGYVFYGSLFIAVGSLAESMQDAQTLTVPVMIALTACVLVVPAGLTDAEAPLVVLASWIPFSAPFAAIVRLPADPSWLTLFGIALMLLLSTALVAWLATRAFRHGVLSGAGLKGVFAGLKARFA